MVKAQHLITLLSLLVFGCGACETPPISTEVASAESAEITQGEAAQAIKFFGQPSAYKEQLCWYFQNLDSEKDVVLMVRVLTKSGWKAETVTVKAGKTGIIRIPAPSGAKWEATAHWPKDEDRPSQWPRKLRAKYC